ncbi:hypothetical protein GIB67_033542 [Kingdonia uniflora]|uniref:Pentatricopeptide repeat-containing protein n=1 Tax=Kingdonia uniflora TaxID=39325 RepID=A0A7J7L6E9_9MAGN|nr:hypothetical protein GIB67_033542 [Kingdonia uniflora]
MPLQDLLSSRSSSKSLKCIHAQIITDEFSRDPKITTKLITLWYTICSTMNHGRKLFEEIPQSDVFVWNTLIRGYAIMGPCEDALFLYRDMHFSRLLLDNYTFPSVVRSCAVLYALRDGKEAHCNVIKNGLGYDMFVRNSLDILSLEFVFEGIVDKNIVSWTAACKHSSLLEEGKKHFESMTRDYSIMPGIEHCACLVDLLGRAGLLVEAYEFIKRMLVKPDDYTRRWENVERLKKLMNEKELKKISGRSLVEIDKRFHQLLSSPKPCPL